MDEGGREVRGVQHGASHTPGGRPHPSPRHRERGGCDAAGLLEDGPRDPRTALRTGWGAGGREGTENGTQTLALGTAIRGMAGSKRQGDRHNPGLAFFPVWIG